MVAGTLDKDSLFHCFEDVISFLNVCEEEQNSISRPLIECVINRLESAAKFVENILPIVNEYKGELTEAAGNLRVLFHSWCRKLTERGLRNTPNCTHLAVYLLSPPELTVKGGPGRPKYEIDEETLLHFRALGFKWKDIAELLLRAGNNSRSSDIVRPNFEYVRPISHFDRTRCPNISTTQLTSSPTCSLSVKLA